MGLAYKAFQLFVYFGLEWGGDIGKEVDKDRERERTNKLYNEAREMVDYDALDRHWDNLLQDCWDNSPPAFGKKSPRHSD